MSKTDSKPTKNLDEMVKKILEPYLRTLESLMQERITSEFETYNKSLKMREKMQMDTLESHVNTTNFAMKELNYKLGALSGRNTRKEKEDNVVLETNSLEDAITAANKIREKSGLPPIKMPGSTTETP